jgi:hypothetical protein
VISGQYFNKRKCSDSCIAELFLSWQMVELFFFI